MCIRDRHSPEEARTLLYRELDRVIADGITPREFEKVQNRTRASFVFGLQTSMSRARRLAELELYHGDATQLRSERGRDRAVTAEDIQRVAARYLVAETRTVLDVLPTSMAPASGEDEEGGEEGEEREPAAEQESEQ